MRVSAILAYTCTSNFPFRVTQLTCLARLFVSFPLHNFTPVSCGFVSQFLEFSKHRWNDSDTSSSRPLANEVLAEIPEQFLACFSHADIKPRRARHQSVLV